MPTVFRLRSALALAAAIAGATMVAMPANLFGQTFESGPQANTVQQPAGFDSVGDIDQLAQVPQSPAPSAPGTAAPGPTATLPTAPVPAVPNPNALAQSSNSALSGMNSANGAAQQFSLASTPNMIGDLLSGNFGFSKIELGPNGTPIITAGGGSLPIAGGDRLTKISEDTSPIPTDRVFADFNHFNGAALTVDGRIISVNRYTFGIEKTFFDGTCSIEIRAPIENGLSADESDPAGANGNVGTSLGDVSIIPKVLVAQSDTWAASVGMAITLPTAPDVFEHANRHG